MWAWPGPRPAGSSRVRPYRSRSASGGSTPEAAAHSSRPVRVAGGASVQQARRPGRARPPRPGRSRTGVGRLAVSMRQRSPARPAGAPACSPWAGLASRRARSSRSVSRSSLSVPSGWSAGQHEPRATSVELGGHPACRDGQPSGHRVGLGGGQPAGRAARPPRRRAEPVVQVLPRSRARRPPPAATAARGHDPGARQQRGQRVRCVAAASARRRDRTAGSSALGVGRQRLGQAPVRWYRGVAGPVAVGGERHPVRQVLAEQVGDGSDPPGVLGRRRGSTSSTGRSPAIARPTAVSSSGRTAPALGRRGSAWAPGRSMTPRGSGPGSSGSSVPSTGPACQSAAPHSSAGSSGPKSRSGALVTRACTK